MNNTKKNFVWNMIGATVNSFTSLIFMIVVTRINGTKEAGIFTFAFSLACLLQVISNYSGRTFQVTNTDKEIKDSDFVYNRISSCIIMIIFVIMFLLAKNYGMYKNIIILLFILYKGIESFTDVFYGVIQKNDELYKVGVSLFLKGIIGVINFLIFDFLTHNIIISISSLILTNLAVTIFYDYKNFIPIYQKNNYNSINNRKLFKLGIFVFGFTFLTQYMLNAPKYAIDDLLSDEMQAIYGIVSMPASFIVLCSQFIIQPLLVKITNLIENKENENLLKLCIKTISAILIIGCISLVLAYFLGIQVLDLIYNVNLEDYLLPLLVIIVGATFFSMSFVISNVLTAMRKTFIQIIFYIICSIVILFLSKYMVLNYGVLGGTISYAITMMDLFALYICYFTKVIRKKGDV